LGRKLFTLPSMAPVYHLEMRSFPHVARVFNLDRETLDTRFVKPWKAGEMIDYDDRRWAPDKTKLTVFEGAELSVAARGLGRGWGEVTRSSRDVTETVVAEISRGADARPDVDALKDAIAEVADGEQPIDFPDVVALAVAAHPLWRASEQLSLAEQAVWEMLHQHRLEMLRNGDAVPAEGWQDVVLRFVTWAGLREGPEIRLRAL
jgi:hypothetical protein